VAVIGGLAAHEWVAWASWVLVGLSPLSISHLALRSIGAPQPKVRTDCSLDRLGRMLSPRSL